MRHDLKTWPEPFKFIWCGSKKHEIRKHDRPFAFGDELLLREFDPETCHYSGAGILARVTHITKGGAWGLPPELCVMSIEPIGWFPDKAFEEVPP